MAEKILAGQGRDIIELPRSHWEAALAKVPDQTQAYLGFMSEDHHSVRRFVVRQIALRGVPLVPEFVAEELHLPLSQVLRILDDLEQKLFFLVRNEQGEVSWAFPVTAEETPHRLRFKSGESLWAA